MTRSAAPRDPILLLNPVDDESFRRAVEIWQPARWDAAGLQRHLRDRYPDALVRPRDLPGEERATWYVYRDGHWINSVRAEGRRPLREGRAARRRTSADRAGPASR